MVLAAEVICEIEKTLAQGPHLKNFFTAAKALIYASLTAKITRDNLISFENRAIFALYLARFNRIRIYVFPGIF
jgi:hypothetical protein